MLTSMRIRNFLSFRDASVDLPPFCVIVGPNNAGKSNFKRALNVLGHLASGVPVVDSLRLACGSLANVFHQGPRWKQSREMEIEVRVQVTPDGRKRPVRLVYRIRLKRVGRIYVVQSEQMTKELPGSKAAPITILKNLSGSAEYRDSSGKKPIKMKLSNRHAALSLLHDLELHREAIALRDFLQRMWFFDLEPAQMRSVIPDASQAGFYHPSGFNIAGTLTHIAEEDPRAFRDIRETLSGIVHEVTGIQLLEMEDDSIYMRFKEKGIRRPISVYAVSDGILRVLGLLVAVFGPDAPSLLFMEEIDKGVHFRRIRDIVSLLRASLGPSKKPRRQVILTTHNPYLIDLIEPEQMIIAERSADETVFIPVTSLDKIGLIRSFLNEGETLGGLWWRGNLGGTPSQE